MAVVSGTIQNIWGHTTVLGPSADSSGNPVLGCFVSATFSGTYSQSDKAAISAVATAIQNSRRDGKTVTLIDAACASAAVTGTTMGAKATAISTADITCDLSKTTLLVEHDAATVINSNPIAFFVLYKLS